MEEKSLKETLNDILKKSSFVFIGKIIGVILTMVFTFFVTRYLGAEVYGKYIYIFSILSFFAIFVRLGLDNGILYFMPKLISENKEKDIEKFITITLAFVSISSIIVILFIKLFGADLISNSLNKPEIFDGLRIMIPMIFLIGLQSVLVSIYKSFNRVNEFVLSTNIITPITQTFFFIWLYYIGFRFYGIVISVTLGYIIGIVYLLINLKNKMLKLNFNFDYIKEYRKVILFSTPVFLNGLVSFFIEKTDTFMIGYYLTNLEVGVYNVALKVGTLSIFILSAFNTMFAPRISALYQKGKVNDIEYLYKKITNYSLSITALIFMMILVFNKEFMLIFGKDFLIGSTALIIIGIGQIVNSGVGPAGYINVMTGNPRYALYISSIAIFLNVGLNIIMIPKWGINGAAIASMLSNIFKNLGRLFFVWRDHKIHPYSKQMLINIIKIALIGVLMFLFKMLIFDDIFYSIITI